MIRLEIDEETAWWLRDLMRVLGKSAAPQKTFMARVGNAVRLGRPIPSDNPESILKVGSGDHDNALRLFNLLDKKMEKHVPRGGYNAV